jgi:N-acetylglucosamine-6-phosphate deacetylase
MSTGPPSPGLDETDPVSHPPLLLSGGTVLDTATATWTRDDLLLVDGRVAGRGPEAGRQRPASATVLDVAGLLVTPGLVDAQVNGACGVDLTREPERVAEVAATLTRSGVTAFVPTVISSPAGTVERVAAAVAALERPGPQGPHARALGVHTEGPFLAPARRGAHPLQHLRAPDPDAVARWSPQAGVQVVTLAPELPGALDVVRALVERGVQVWIGHTEATYAQTVAAGAAGARAVTHLCNAMPRFDHREPGPVGAALGDGRLVAGVIVDGHHVHPAMVRTAWRALGPGRFMLVSDTTAALGLPPGRTVLGDQDVVLDGATVRLADAPDTLAGSAVGLDHCVRTLVAMTGCPPADALVAATRTPADLLGRPDLGRLDVGAAADVALWDADLHLHGVIVGGVVPSRA